MATTPMNRLRIPARPSSGATALLALAVVLTVVLGARAWQAWQALRRPATAQVADADSIRPWMDVRFIARTQHVPVAELAARLGAPPSGHVTLLDLARQRDVPVRQVEDEARRAVAELRAAGPREGPTRAPGPGG